jgi:hypothetical protein
VLQKFDHPLMFLFVMTIGVFAMASVISYGLAALGWTGPLGIFKGGVVQS